MTERYQPIQPVGLREGLAVGVGRGIEAPWVYDGGTGAAFCATRPRPWSASLGQEGTPYKCLVQI